MNVLQNDTYDLAIDPRDPDVWYAGVRARGIFKSTDAGATWTSINQTLSRTLIDHARAAGARPSATPGMSVSAGPGALPPDPRGISGQMKTGSGDGVTGGMELAGKFGDMVRADLAAAADDGSAVFDPAVCKVRIDLWSQIRAFFQNVHGSPLFHKILRNFYKSVGVSANGNSLIC